MGRCTMNGQRPRDLSVEGWVSYFRAMSKKPATDNSYVLYQEATHRTVDFIQELFHTTLEENSVDSHKNFKKALIQKMKGGDATIDDKKLLAFLSSGEWDWKREIKEMSEGWLDAVNADDPYVEGGKTLTEALGYKWSEKHYRKYAEEFSFPEYETLLYEQGEFPALMGVVNGIHYGVQVLEEFQELWEAGISTPHLYKDSSFSEANAAQIASVSDNVYQDLVGSLKLLIDRGDVDANTIVANDTNAFEAFLDTSVPMTDSSYVADRLDFTASDMESLAKRRNHVLLGRYKKGFLSYDQEQRVDYGIILGIQRYVEYLNTEYGFYAATANKHVLDHEPLDDRIPLDPRVLEYVKKCFGILKLDEEGLNISEPIMSSDDVDELLQSNFVIGKPLPRKPLKANFKKGYLAYFFGQVLRRLTVTTGIPLEGLQVKHIVRFVRDNFPEYSSDNPASVEKSLRRKKPENFPKRIRGAMNGHFEDLKAELGIRSQPKV